jgi:integral membrane protein (TIGR00529 family)
LVFLDTIPAIVKILVVFAAMLLAIHRKKALGHVFTVGAVVLGLIFGLDPIEIIRSLFLALISPKTLGLAIIVSLILVLSHSMEAAGQMERLLGRFRGLLRHPGLNLIAFPALIGLLPMPGGAIFSAPMVKSIGQKYALSGAQLSYSNYWFRHIWEYWWPLYPGVLLTTTIARLDLLSFVLLLFPLTPVAYILGYWPLRSALKHHQSIQPRSERGAGHRRVTAFFKELVPIMIVVVGGLGLGALFSYIPWFRTITVTKEMGLVIALVVSIWWVWRYNQLSVQARKTIVTRPALYRMFYMVAGILIFQGLLTDSQAVRMVSEELLRWKIPLLPITIILPALVGMVAGITIAFVGTTFPILISLVQAFGESHLLLPYMMLALACGFMGVMVSPLHLCLLLSNEYFHTRLPAVYRQLVFPCVALMVCALLYFGLLRYYFYT